MNEIAIIAISMSVGFSTLIYLLIAAMEEDMLWYENFGEFDIPYYDMLNIVRFLVVLVIVTNFVPIMIAQFIWFCVRGAVYAIRDDYRTVTKRKKK